MDTDTDGMQPGEWIEDPAGMETVLLEWARLGVTIEAKFGAPHADGFAPSLCERVVTTKPVVEGGETMSGAFLADETGRSMCFWIPYPDAGLNPESRFTLRRVRCASRGIAMLKARVRELNEAMDAADQGHAAGTISVAECDAAASAWAAENHILLTATYGPAPRSWAWVGATYAASDMSTEVGIEDGELWVSFDGGRCPERIPIRVLEMLLMGAAQPSSPTREDRSEFFSDELGSRQHMDSPSTSWVGEPGPDLLGAVDLGIKAKRAQHLFSDARRGLTERQRWIVDIATADAAMSIARNGVADLAECVEDAISHVATSPHFAHMREDS